MSYIFFAYLKIPILELHLNSKLFQGKKRQVGWFPATFVKLNEAEESGEQENVRALFDYQGQQEDELTFKEGDVIKILSKDGEWWKGKNGDQEGVFPANYVEVIPKEG